MSALDVECPQCERKPGFPCQSLSGFNSMRAWFVDVERGGVQGKPDIKRPHYERETAWRASQSG